MDHAQPHALLLKRRHRRLLHASLPQRGASTILVENGRITAINDAAAAIPAGATIVDQSSKTVLPGLIDGTRTGAVGFGGALTVSGDRVSGDAGVVLGAGLAGFVAPRNTVEEFSAFLSRQVALHTRVVRDANIRVE